MTARISNLQIYNRGLDNLVNVQKAVAKTQQQISTGKRVITPGDDPVASTRIIALTQELKLNALYNNNADNLQSRLERADVALSNISDLQQRAQELVIQAGDGALDAEQRGFIAIELEGIIDSMASSMNSRDGSGNFIFAGLKVDQQPYVKGGDGRYQYLGDDGQQTVQLGPSSFVAGNESGSALFERVASNTYSAKARANPGNQANPPATISSPVVTDQDAFGLLYPEDLIIEFRPPTEVDPTQSNYIVKQVSDGRVVQENVPFQPGARVEVAGVSLRINGAPAEGDTFLINSTRETSLLGTLEDFTSKLRSLDDTPEDRARLTDSIADTLGNLDNAQTVLLEGLSAVGSRLNLVDNVKSTNADIKLATQASLSELQDLDFAEAVSRLSQESFVLEAAQASFARVSGLSLFNYLR